MEYQSFEGQSAFEDYARIAKPGYEEEAVTADVLEQLNQQLTEEELFYRLAAEDAKEGQVFCFLSANECLPKTLTPPFQQNFVMMAHPMSMRLTKTNNLSHAEKLSDDLTDHLKAFC